MQVHVVSLKYISSIRSWSVLDSLELRNLFRAFFAVAHWNRRLLLGQLLLHLHHLFNDRKELEVLREFQLVFIGTRLMLLSAHRAH